MDSENIEKAVRAILIAVGEDPSREGLIETPKRVAKMYKEFFVKSKPTRSNVKLFKEKFSNGFVCVRNVSFSSICEHHLLPFMGHVDIVCMPNEKILGLSKFARIVDECQGYFQTQERFNNRVIAKIEEIFETVLVRVSALHTCMTTRGVLKEESTTVTIKFSRKLLNDKDLKLEALAMLGNYK